MGCSDSRPPFPPHFVSFAWRYRAYVLEAELDHLGTREYIKVLRLLEKATIPQLANAIEQCLALGALSVDAVRVILEARRECPVGLFSLDDRPQLKLVRVQAPDLGASAP